MWYTIILTLITKEGSNGQIEGHIENKQQNGRIKFSLTVINEM